MSTMKFYILTACLIAFNCFGQNALPQPIPDMISLDGTDLNSFNGTYNWTGAIEISPDMGDNVLINDDQQVKVISDVSIDVYETTEMAPNEDGFAELKITNEVSAAWFYPEATPGTVGRYEKFEFGLNLPDEIDALISDYILDSEGGLNPYDPDDISIEATFKKAVGGPEITRYGFYYRQYKPSDFTSGYAPDFSPYDWRIRFSPWSTGTWEVSVKVFISGVETYNDVSFSFVCVGSDNKGPLTQTSAGEGYERYFSYLGTGETFFAMGHSLSLPTKDPELLNQAYIHEDYRQLFTDISDYGANFARIEMGLSSYLPNWDNYKNYSPRMIPMWEMDRLLDHFAELEMYFMTFRHHIELRNADFWSQNPFRLGLGLTNQDEYFTNAEALEWQRNCTRYMMARWGYSVNWMGYTYSEVDNWLIDYYPEVNDKWNDPDDEQDEDGDWEEIVGVFADWMYEEKVYIQSELQYSHIKMTGTFATFGHIDNNEDLIFDTMDFTGRHEYREDKERNWDRANGGLYDDYSKPFIFEEIGHSGNSSDDDFVNLYCCSGTGFHNDLWSTAMMGGFGAGMNFWFDRGIQEHEYYTDYAALSKFFENEDLNALKLKPHRWKDDNIDAMKVESYAMVSDDKKYALGWVHNATYYWRNMTLINPCINELVENAEISEPCFYPDGWVHDGLDDGEENVFALAMYEDDYTPEGGAVDIADPEGIEYNPTFTIKNLKVDPVGPYKHWYQVEFYNTKTGSKVYTQVTTTNDLGRLKPFVPNLNEDTPDYAYKVCYLGKFTDNPGPKIAAGGGEIVDGEMEEDSSLSKKQDVTLSVYPNPSNGEFTISSPYLIQYLNLVSVNGQIVYSVNDIGSNQIKINCDLSNGIYIVQVYTDQGVIAKKIKIETSY